MSEVEPVTTEAALPGNEEPASAAEPAPVAETASGDEEPGPAPPVPPDAALG